MDKKPWYQSKTIWLNVIIAITAVLAETDTGLPPTALPWITAVGVVANVLLRILTGQPIGGTAK